MVTATIPLYYHYPSSIITTTDHKNDNMLSDNSWFGTAVTKFKFTNFFFIPVQPLVGQQLSTSLIPRLSVLKSMGTRLARHSATTAIPTGSLNHGKQYPPQYLLYMHMHCVSFHFGVHDSATIHQWWKVTAEWVATSQL